jgi:CheY-like chemotaxis protein
MNIEQKIKNLEINRMLVADDLSENITAAKDAFSRYSKLHVDYVSSASDAKKKIAESFADSKYDLILSDMNMESHSSGFEVMTEAMKYHTLTAIVTGIAAGGEGNHAHGPQTKIIIAGYEKVLEGNKSESRIWSEAFENVIDYLSGGGSSLYKSMQRYHKYVNKPSEDLEKFGKMIQ